MRRSWLFRAKSLEVAASWLIAFTFPCWDAHGGAMESLETSLKKQGFESGYNSSSDSYVFIGFSEHDVDASAVRDLNLLWRNAWCLEAELNARKAMVKGLMTEFRASGKSEVSNDGGREVRKSHSDSVHLAQRVLLGCTTVGSEEVYSDGRYQIAVAVKWSERDERRTIESFLDARYGATTSGVWTNWLSKTDVAVLPSTWSFVGDDGLIRHVGVGCADVEGVEETSLFMRSAQNSALTWARASLSLALCSDFSSFDRTTVDLLEQTSSGESSEIGCADVDGAENTSPRMRNAKDSALTSARENLSFALRSDSSSFARRTVDLSEQTGSEKASRQLEKKLNSHVAQTSRKLTAFAPEVYSTFAVHPITKRRMFVSVCGFEPWQLAELGIIDRKMLQRPRIETPAQKPAIENSGVMIFNPNTGKFEEQKQDK